MLELNILTNVDQKKELELENFIINSNYVFNPLFSTPLWARRLKKLLDFNYEYLIIKEKEKQELIALHLILYGYRGFARFRKHPYILKKGAIFFSKIFFSYITWYNFILFKNNLDEDLKLKCKRIIYEYIQNKNMKILNSPIYEGDERFFNSRKIKEWGTYILNFKNRSYNEIYSSFKRQARRSIEKARGQGIYVKTLDIHDENELNNFIKFLKSAQKVTGKGYKINNNDIIKEYDFFSQKNYIYEIFLAYYKDEIHGSLGVWGFNDYISEHGVNYSKFAKKNKLYLQDIIKDEIVKFSLKNGINYYDLSGFNPNKNASQKEKNIKRFKKKFNGEEIIYKIVRE